MVPISRQMRLDLADLKSLRRWAALSRWPSERHTWIRWETDASSLGWGFALYGRKGLIRGGGLFSGEEMPHIIATKEAWAVRKALEIPEVVAELEDSWVTLFVDNTNVQHTLLRGTSKIPEVREVTRWLVEFQLQHRFIIRCSRVTSAQNLVADRESRGYVEPPVHIRGPGDVMLRYELFRRIQTWYGEVLTLDACACSWSFQTRRFISRAGRDPAAPRAGVEVAVDVFSFTFEDRREHVYCFPPESLIDPLWRHLKECGARGVLLAPVRPDQPWYGTVLADAVRTSLFLKAGSGSVFLSPRPNRRGIPYTTSEPPLGRDLFVAAFDFPCA